MERVRVELTDVPEGLTVYVKAYFPQADKNGGRGELKVAVEAFGGVAVGKPRYGWMHRDIFNLSDANAAIKVFVTAYPKLKLCKTIAKIGAAPAAEPPPPPKRKPTEAPFFSPETKMQWHARRARRERAWADAQQTVSSLITRVAQKTVPQLEGLNKRLCAKLNKLKAELKSANMSNSAFKKAKGKAHGKKLRRKGAFESDASVTIKPRNVKEVAADKAGDKPSGKFKDVCAAHLGYCVQECWTAQVLGHYNVEVKQKTQGGSCRKPKPWARFFVIDKGSYATEAAIHIAGRSFQTSKLPAATTRAGFAAKVGDHVPPLGGKPRYTVYSLKGCMWTGSKKSAEYKKLLLGNDSGALDDLAASALKS